MKKTIQKSLLILFMITLSYQIKAQAPIQNGGSNYAGDLWHLKNIGVGSNLQPNARIHIFNGLSSREGYLPLTKFTTGTRAFLITGQIEPNLAPTNPPSFPAPIEDFVVTVDRLGQFGVDILNPFSKMNLHNGIFTISAGAIEEPTRWEVHGTQNAFAVKDFNANRYRFWINKSNGNVGIGTESPDEKLHVKDGILKVENASGTTTYGSLNAGFSHFVTSLPKFYFNKSIYIDGAVSSYQTDLLLQANGATGIKVKTDGKVIIGATSIASGAHTNYKLSVDGLIVSKKVVVTLDNWADNVFDEKYELRSLAEIEKFVKQQKHLPEIPSEAEVLENGVELGEINMLLLKKVEELTLYIIDMQKQIDDLKTAK